MRIHHTRFKSLSALGIDKSWGASARFKTELIFHADTAQGGHETIQRGKVEFARFSLHLIPRDVKTDASQFMICADTLSENV